MRLYWRSKKPFPTDILINQNISEDGVSLVCKMVKSNPADRMTVTMALLHSWVSVQESTSTSGYLDSFEENTEDELDGKLANEGSCTKIRDSIPVSVLKSNVEDTEPLFNAAIASHTEHRNLPHVSQELSLCNSYLTNLQNEEVAQLRKPMPNAEERIFDSSDEDTNEDTDTPKSRSNLADS